MDAYGTTSSILCLKPTILLNSGQRFHSGEDISKFINSLHTFFLVHFPLVLFLWEHFLEKLLNDILKLCCVQEYIKPVTCTVTAGQNNLTDGTTTFVDFWNCKNRSNFEEFFSYSRSPQNPYCTSWGTWFEIPSFTMNLCIYLRQLYEVKPSVMSHYNHEYSSSI